MANKPLQAVSLVSPGFFGINSQDSGVTLDQSFSLEGDNAVIDKSGRMASRKGWEYNTTAGGTSSLPELLFEFDNNTATGSFSIISAGNNKLFTGETTMTEQVVKDASAATTLSYTISEDDWQFEQSQYQSGTNLSPHGFLVQKDHSSLVYHKMGSAHTHTGVFGFQRLGDIGSVPSGYTTDTFKPNCALSAFGRMFFADISNDPLTIYFSVLLDGADLTGSGSGQLNLEKVIAGGDKIVALAEHNNALIIFCERNIVIYNNADNISEISLADVIVGTGCIARDSIQNIGTDIIFLSDSGLLSLGRTIQEKSAPLRDLSKNIRDNFLSLLAVENKSKIKSVYYKKEAFYLLTFPNSSFTFCFDIRASLQDGSYRVTRWDNINPSSLLATRNGRLLLGKTNGIAEYKGYTDNTESYVFSYLTPYIDFGRSEITKMLKKINVTVVGASATTLSFKWAFDYANDYNTIDAITKAASISEYGSAEYNIAEYSASIFIDKITSQLTGSGNVLQIGVNAVINKNALSLQKIDIYSVLGRTI